MDVCLNSGRYGSGKILGNLLVASSVLLLILEAVVKCSIAMSVKLNTACFLCDWGPFTHPVKGYRPIYVIYVCSNNILRLLLN